MNANERMRVSPRERSGDHGAPESERERGPAGAQPPGIRSVHIDSARTWRGGQNQVLLTVTGLEELGNPAVLVAHESGELKRRAREGLRFIGFSPKSEFDVHAAWQLGRVFRDSRPDVV